MDNNTFDESVIRTDAFQIPVGFRRKISERVIESNRAKQCLKSNQKNRITSAEKCECAIKITKDYFVCPVCGKHISAYPRYFGMRNTSIISDSDVDRLCDNQLSFFNSRIDNKIKINEPFTDVECIKCPKCFESNPVSETMRECIITVKDYSLTITCELTSIKELFEIDWIKDRKIKDFSFPLYEKITFDILNGITYAELNDDKKTLFTKEINSGDLQNKNNPIISLLSNHISKPKINRAFKNIYGKPLPFSYNEMDINKYMILTRFIGYNREFYDTIPYKINNITEYGELDDTFIETAFKLSKVSDVPNVFKETSMPQIKSIKRIIYKNPQLLFYYKTLELIWRIIGDSNCFCRLLNSEYIFHLLSYVHQYENVSELLLLMKEVKGKIWLCRRLTNIYTLNETLVLGLAYSSMGKEKRETIKNALKNDAKHIYGWISFVHISYPPVYKKMIPDCIINNYQFVQLPSTGVLNRAGKFANNCFEQYSDLPYCTTYGIKYNEKNVATIEINDNTVMRVYTAVDEEIEENCQLYSAFNKWCQRFHLVKYFVIKTPKGKFYLH